MKNKKGTSIVITSGKGGVGKTTTSANISSGLAKEGKSVVVIDADIGLRNLDVVMGLENRIVYDLVDVVKGHCKLKQGLIRDKRFDSLYILPAAQTKDKSVVSVEEMKALVSDLKKEFDYVIIDSPAGIEQGFQYSIAGADKAIIVTTPEVSAVRDADRVIGLLEANEISEPMLIVNRLRKDMVQRGDMMDVEDVVDILAVKLVGVVPDDEEIVISTNKGEPAVINSKGLASQAYMNIAKRINGQEVEFLELNKKEKNKLTRIIELIFSK